MPKTESSRYSIHRSGVKSKDWNLERIDSAGDFLFFNKFCCGDCDLDDFIKKDALGHKQELIAETYVLKEATVDFPVAFISFCNDSIPLSKLRRKSKDVLRIRYENLPAVKIARLGVAQEFQDKNIGTFMINMAKEFFLTDNRTGCRFLTVDAYNNERVINFYTKNDFKSLKVTETTGTVIMYLDLKRLEINGSAKENKKQ
jgi:GNAT superfamily N-acetyltransferase